MIYITLLGLLISTISFAAPHCSEPERIFIDQNNLSADDIYDCHSEKWPGLNAFEYYIRITEKSKDFEDPLSAPTHFAVVNTKTKKVSPAPALTQYNSLMQNNKEDEIADEILKKYLSGLKTKFTDSKEVRVTCKNNHKDNTYIALKPVLAGFQWEINLLQPQYCQSFISSEIPTATLGEIHFKNLKVPLDPSNGVPDLSHLNVEYLPQQAYFEISGLNDDLQWLTYKPKQTCDEIKSIRFKASVHSLFDRTTFFGRKALQIKISPLVADHFMSTPLTTYPAKILLESKDAANEIKLKGAWQVAHNSDLDNLIIDNDKTEKLRIRLRDLDCGREYVSNWFD